MGGWRPVLIPMWETIVSRGTWGSLLPFVQCPSASAPQIWQRRAGLQDGRTHLPLLFAIVKAFRHCKIVPQLHVLELRELGLQVFEGPVPLQ